MHQSELGTSGSREQEQSIAYIYIFKNLSYIAFLRKWAHKMGKLQEPTTRNIPRLNV